MNKKIIIPNAITGLSLISGLTALHFTFENNFILAAWLIAFSMLCDGLDGKIARLLNAQSRFGAQFDTLSDFVAFGVVPGFMVYRYKLSELSTIRSEEHTSELQSHHDLVCRLLLEKKKFF